MLNTSAAAACQVKVRRHISMHEHRHACGQHNRLPKAVHMFDMCVQLTLAETHGPRPRDVCVYLNFRTLLHTQTAAI